FARSRLRMQQHHEELQGLQSDRQQSAPRLPSSFEISLAQRLAQEALALAQHEDLQVDILAALRTATQSFHAAQLMDDSRQILTTLAQFPNLPPWYYELQSLISKPRNSHDDLAPAKIAT